MGESDKEKQAGAPKGAVEGIEAEVTQAEANTPARKKRRLKAQPTLREQAEKASKKRASLLEPKDPTVAAAFVRGFLTPFRIIGRVLHKISRFVIPPYFRNAWKELKQVTWLSFRDSRRLTGAVIGFAVVFGIVIALLDYGLDKLFKSILLK